jgi:CubicO group peptidase (beta-lactamase class C family)
MSLNKNQICLKFSLLLPVLLFWLTGLAQYKFPELDELLQQYKKPLGNDFAALVWKDGKIIYQKQTVDFTAKTQAPILNAGNWLTAALVMAFVDDGKISLEDKVSKYIPLFATYMKGYITIRNCLTNTTGIHVEAGALKVFQKSKFASLEEEVNAFASKREIESNPGTQFYYSNIGPNIAARVLEIITKKSFDRLIQERILRPLKMRATSFSNNEGGAIDPAGGARSTANDYINFLSMLLNKGNFDGKKILSAKAVEDLETAQFTALPVKYIPKQTEGLQYAMGSWVMETGTDGKSSVLSCPNMAGSLPYIDKCRNYAAIILLAAPETEIQKAFFTNFKDRVDRQIPPSCK